MEYIPYLITPAFFLMLEIYGVIWRHKWDMSYKEYISKSAKVTEE